MITFLSKYFKKPIPKEITIVHADDHSLFRYGVRKALLEYTDIKIIGESANGLELLKLLETTIPDIVILNINMPVMNGLATLPEIKRRYPHLKVIILSMHTSPEMITKLLLLGANSYLSKNIDSVGIYKAIKCVYDYDFYYSEAMAGVPIGSDFNMPKPKYKLTNKESKILELLNNNRTVKEIAIAMDLSERTVSAIIEKIKNKNESAENR